MVSGSLEAARAIGLTYSMEGSYVDGVVDTWKATKSPYRSGRLIVRPYLVVITGGVEGCIVEVASFWDTISPPSETAVELSGDKGTSECPYGESWNGSCRVVHVRDGGVLSDMESGVGEDCELDTELFGTCSIRIISFSF
jgi:hypothetical protein